MNKLAHFLHHNRSYVIAACWLAALGMGMFLPRMEIDPEVEALVPLDMESRVSTDKIENIFGGSDNIILLFECEDVLAESTLERIKSIEKSLKKLPDIESTLSVMSSKSIRGEGGMMMVDQAVKRIPGSESRREKLRNELINNELVYELVVSKDFRYAAIITNLQKEINNEGILIEIEEIINENPGKEAIYLGGMPVVSRAISSDINKDLKFLLPLALILMVLILWTSFRSFNGVFLPFSIVIMSILVSMGLMPVFGWKLALVSVLLPIMLIAIANNYGIHIYNRNLELQEENSQLSGPQKISVLWKALAKPIILTGLTTIAGILGLLGHIIIPAKQVGILAAFGITWALLMSLIYIPAYLSGLKTSYKNAASGSKSNLLERGLKNTAIILSNNPIPVLATGFVILIFMSIGIFKLKVEGNTVNFFSKENIVRKSSDLIDKHMGGSQTISIHFSGDIKSPDLLKRMLQIEEQMKETAGVGQVMSIASVVKTMSKSLLDPADEDYNSIPSDRDAVAQYFELYSFSGDPSDFEQLVDFSYENAQMLVRVNNSSSAAVLKVVDKIKSLTKNDESVISIGGIGLITAEMTDKLIKGQNQSLIFALLVVTLLIIMIFRSVKAGLLSLVPLLSACIVLFGLMGWLGIKLDAATALLSSIMIGVGVDYTIHYLWRHKQETAAGKTNKEAVIITLSTTGRGITFNALSVMIGFAALLFSTFNPIRFFGFLTSVSILSCLTGALLIIPALILLTEPSFIGGQKNLKRTKTKKDVQKYPRHSPPAYSGGAVSSK